MDRPDQGIEYTYIHVCVRARARVCVCQLGAGGSKPLDPGDQGIEYALGAPKAQRLPKLNGS
jgi:hypothetical protein